MFSKSVGFTLCIYLVKTPLKGASFICKLNALATAHGRSRCKRQYYSCLHHLQGTAALFNWTIPEPIQPIHTQIVWIKKKKEKKSFVKACLLKPITNLFGRWTWSKESYFFVVSYTIQRSEAKLQQNRRRGAAKSPKIKHKTKQTGK